MKHKAMAGSSEMLILIQDVSSDVVIPPDAFRFSEAHVGVSAIPYFCPHALFGGREGWGGKGTIVSFFLFDQLHFLELEGCSLSCVWELPDLRCVLFLLLYGFSMANPLSFGFYFIRARLCKS